MKTPQIIQNRPKNSKPAQKIKIDPNIQKRPKNSKPTQKIKPTQILKTERKIRN